MRFGWQPMCQYYYCKPMQTQWDKQQQNILNMWHTCWEYADVNHNDDDDDDDKV